MSDVYVVVAVEGGSVYELEVFDNREAAEQCKASFEGYLSNTKIIEREIREVFSNYACPSCGSTCFIMRWMEPMSITVEYDPSSDSFDVCSQSVCGDNNAEDVELECDSCGATLDHHMNGDLEDRIWNCV